MSIETTKHDSPRINSGRRLFSGKRDSSLSSTVEVVARRSLPDVLINNANDFPLNYTPLSGCHERCANLRQFNTTMFKFL